MYLCIFVYLFALYLLYVYTHIHSIFTIFLDAFICLCIYVQALCRSVCLSTYLRYPILVPIIYILNLLSIYYLSLVPIIYIFPIYIPILYIPVIVIFFYLYSPPPPLSPLQYDIFSWAVHIDRPYGALNIFHTGGSVVGVGVAIVVLTICLSICLSIYPNLCMSMSMSMSIFMAMSISISIFISIH